MKNKILVTIILVANFTMPFVFAATPEEAMQNALQLAESQKTSNTESIKPEETKQEVPDWVKRTNFAVEAGTNQKAKYFLETIQPLLGTQDKDLVFFNQSRISSRDERPTYNIGLGLRRIFNDSYLLGINSFYDYQDLHKHSRAGLGFEAITDKGLESRVNTYAAVSGSRLVSEDSVNSYYEKVANGLDWELGGPLPHLPFLKVYGGGSWYNFDHFKNKTGWKGRLEFSPVKYSRLGFEVYNDSKLRDTSYRLEGALTLAFTSFAFSDIIKDIKSTETAYPKVNLRDKVLDRVVRDFDITVIKSTKSKSTGLTVEGGKSG